MRVPPLRPVENLLVLLAGLLVAGGLLPWALRLACVVAAVGIILLLAALRFKAHAGTVQKRRISDVYSSLERIRSERTARYERPSRLRRRP